MHDVLGTNYALMDFLSRAIRVMLAAISTTCASPPRTLSNACKLVELSWRFELLKDKAPLSSGLVRHRPSRQPRQAAILFPDRKSIEIGKDRSCVLCRKVYLRHLLMPGNHPVHNLCLQLSGREPGVNIPHRRGYLERAVANGFHGVATPALLLKDRLSSSLQLVIPGGI